MNFVILGRYYVIGSKFAFCLSELAFNLMERKTAESLMVFQSAGQLLQWRQIDN
jgi:hypothetical protein